MKKFLNLLLVLVLAVSCIACLTACEDNNGDTTKTETGLVYAVKTDDEGAKYATVKKYALSDEDVKKVSTNNYADIMVDLVIPAEAEVDGVTYPVKAIESGAFSNQVIFKSITAGANVETFGSACFAGCSNLTELSLPFVGNTIDAKNDGKTLGYLFGTGEATGCISTTVYYNASSTKSYFVPTSLKKVTVTGTTLSAYAFYGFNNVEEVVLTEGITEIGEKAFYGMTSLIKFNLPATVTAVGAYAFASCNSILDFGFADATALTTIEEGAFQNCTCFGSSATKDVTVSFGSALTTIGKGAFVGCVGIETLDLSNVTEIGSQAFYKCTALKTLTVNSGATVGANAFSKCSELTQANVTGYSSAMGIGFDFIYED